MNPRKPRFETICRINHHRQQGLAAIERAVMGLPTDDAQVDAFLRDRHTLFMRQHAIRGSSVEPDHDLDFAGDRFDTANQL